MDGGDGNDYLDLGPGDDNATGDEGNDTILPGDGADFAYGEEGSNHIILTSDGVKDLVYCRSERLNSGDGYVTYVGSRSDLDAQRRPARGLLQGGVVTSPARGARPPAHAAHRGGVTGRHLLRISQPAGR